MTTCSESASGPTGWCAGSCSKIKATPVDPLYVPRATGATQLWVKQLVVEGRRYIVCRNEVEANQDAADRKAVLDGLERQLKRGDKALIGNSAHRRFLKSTTKSDSWLFRPGSRRLEWAVPASHEGFWRPRRGSGEVDKVAQVQSR